MGIDREVGVGTPRDGGTLAVHEIVTEDIEATIADLEEAIEVGVTPRAQVNSAKRRLEGIMEHIEEGV